MKKDADYFSTEVPEHEADLVFIAKRLSDATALEAIFEEAGVDYGVEPDEYEGGVIFRTTRIGAFFYVRRGDRPRASEILLRHGYTPSLEEPPRQTGS